MKWLKVKDRLPEIEEDKFVVVILGYVHDLIYDKEGFK